MVKKIIIRKENKTRKHNLLEGVLIFFTSIL
jgi:hypothetical protein